jgi:hypothetical protein
MNNDTSNYDEWEIAWIDWANEVSFEATSEIQRPSEGDTGSSTTVDTEETSFNGGWHSC